MTRARVAELNEPTRSIIGSAAGLGARSWPKRVIPGTPVTPRSHAMMHLDTVMTMVDRRTFVLYPYIDRHFRSWAQRDPAG